MILSHFKKWLFSVAIDSFAILRRLPMDNSQQLSHLLKAVTQSELCVTAFIICNILSRRLQESVFYHSDPFSIFFVAVTFQNVIQIFWGLITFKISTLAFAFLKMDLTQNSYQRNFFINSSIDTLRSHFAAEVKTLEAFCFHIIFTHL